MKETVKIEINSQLVMIIILSIFAGIGIGVIFGRSKGSETKRLRDLEDDLEQEKKFRHHGATETVQAGEGNSCTQSNRDALV